MKYAVRASFAVLSTLFAVTTAFAKEVDVASPDSAAVPPVVRASENTVITYTGAIPPNFTGALDADDSTYNRPVTCAALSGVGTAVAHDTIAITNTTGASANFTVTTSLVGGAVCGDANDTFLTLYGNAGFNPASSLTNCLLVHDDINGGSNRCSTLTFPVPAGESRTVSIAGFNNAAVAGGLFAYEVSFAGTDGTVGAGQLTINPTAVNFGDQSVGTTSAAQTVTLGNTGTLSLDVTALDAAAGAFARAGGTCSNTLPITIAPGTDCTLTYTFTPAAAGPANQTLNVTANQPGSGTIALSGNGVVVPAGLSIAPTSVDFGSVNVGTTSAPSSITLSNTGGAALNVSAVTTSAVFPQAGGTCGAPPFAIAGGASCTLTYTFQPTATGAVSVPFTVTSDAPGPNTFTLAGTGVQGTVTLSAPSLSFGNVTPGNSATLTQTLTNTGTGPAQVTAITAALAPFSLTGGTCPAAPFPLAAGASCTLIYTYAPTTTAPSSQPITVTTDAGSLTFTLQGSSQSLSIPSTNVWALALLVLLLGAIAAPMLRARMR